VGIRRFFASQSFYVRWAIILVALTALIAFCVLLVFGFMNRRLGLDTAVPDEEVPLPDSAGVAPGDTTTIEVIPAFSIPEDTEPEEYRGPEADWPLSPCSIYVAEEGGGFSSVTLDSFPEAPGRSEIPYELHLLVTEWCGMNGYSGDDLGRVYVFSSADTIYIDLPRITGVEALKATIEGRFVCFTRLFLLVAGRQSEAYPDGIPLRGVPFGP
jgi:hypothetical protein